MIESMPDEPEIVENNYFEELMEEKRKQEEAKAAQNQEENRSERQVASVQMSRSHQNSVRQSIVASLNRQSSIRSPEVENQDSRPQGPRSGQGIRPQSLSRSRVRSELEHSLQSQQNGMLRSRSSQSNRPREEENSPRSPTLPPSFLAVSQAINIDQGHSELRRSNNIGISHVKQSSAQESFNSINPRQLSEPEISHNASHSASSHRGQIASIQQDEYPQSSQHSSYRDIGRPISSIKLVEQLPLPDDSSSEDSEDYDMPMPTELAKLQGLNIDYKTAGYQDYLDYVASLKTEREELKMSLQEVKSHLSHLESVNSRNLSRLQDELSGMSFTVEELLLGRLDSK